MNNYNEPFNNENLNIVMYQGAQGKYYVVDDFKYAAQFPIIWAIDHKKCKFMDVGTGPKECSNCNAYGCINDVFVFYCKNCVTHVYNNEDYKKRNELSYKEMIYDAELWEIAPYMHGISLSQIGDKLETYEDDFTTPNWEEDFEEERDVSQVDHDNYRYLEEYYMYDEDEDQEYELSRDMSELLTNLQALTLNESF